MIKSYKGRTLIRGQKVDVYRNLNAGGFSIRDTKTKLVVAHGEFFTVKAATPNVNQKLRSKVLKEKRKNVHAHVSCVFDCDLYEGEEDGLQEVYYNPYELDMFIVRETGMEWEGSESLIFLSKNCKF